MESPETTGCTGIFNLAGYITIGYKVLFRGTSYTINNGKHCSGCCSQPEANRAVTNVIGNPLEIQIASVRRSITAVCTARASAHEYKEKLFKFRGKRRR